MTEEGYGKAWEAQKDEWRRGDSKAQKQAALFAKQTLAYIRANPGCTTQQIKDAGIRPIFSLLIRHNLVYQKRGLPGYWHATRDNPAADSGEKDA